MHIRNVKRCGEFDGSLRADVGIGPYGFPESPAKKPNCEPGSQFGKEKRHIYNRMQIMPPVFSLIMRPSVRVSFCRASSGIRVIFAVTPSETSS